MEGVLIQPITTEPPSRAAPRIVSLAESNFQRKPFLQPTPPRAGADRLVHTSHTPTPGVDGAALVSVVYVGGVRLSVWNTEVGTAERNNTERNNTKRNNMERNNTERSNMERNNTEPNNTERTSRTPKFPAEPNNTEPNNTAKTATAR